MALGEGCLDDWLAGRQPVEGTVELILEIGLDRLLGPDGDRCRDLVLALIVGRLLDPDSKLAAARGLSPDTATSSLGEQLGLAVVGHRAPAWRR